MLFSILPMHAQVAIGWRTSPCDLGFLFNYIICFNSIVNSIEFIMMRMRTCTYIYACICASKYLLAIARARRRNVTLTQNVT